MHSGGSADGALTAYLLVAAKTASANASKLQTPPATNQTRLGTTPTPGPLFATPSSRNSPSALPAASSLNTSTTSPRANAAAPTSPTICNHYASPAILAKQRKKMAGSVIKLRSARETLFTTRFYPEKETTSSKSLPPFANLRNLRNSSSLP